MTTNNEENKIWTTKDGDDIPLNKLGNSHLLNIKKWIEKRAKYGVDQGYFSHCDDDDFMTGDTWTIYGEEVKSYYNYRDILKEIKRRKLN